MIEDVNFPTGTSGGSAITLAVAAARDAGKTLLHASRQVVAVKGKADLVTKADRDSERQLRGMLAREFPSHGILGEEGGGTAGGDHDGYRWVLDPLDGTLNFTRGLNTFAVSVALLRHDRPLVAVTYDPVHDECWTAVRGQGAALNGRALNLRADGIDRPLSEALIGYDLGYRKEEAVETLSIAHDIWPSVQTLRSCGSCALGLAWVAAGRLDAYWHPTAWLWDYAAGWLLIEEAGGTCTDRQGGVLKANERSWVVGGRLELHDSLVEKVRKEGP